MRQTPAHFRWEISPKFSIGQRVRLRGHQQCSGVIHKLRKKYGVHTAVVPFDDLSQYELEQDALEIEC